MLEQGTSMGAFPLAKKKRSLPGTPDPEAEVIALSPKTLMATNRFLCEICGKGFQRDQNLQLHRRGHNLPWKLRQRSGKEQRKRVYVCPEKTCVHSNPLRALGDLTGIKKHFCRKHGEKKWKCEKCSKRYAVQSDWKAHAKVCGTREYRCDCGTIFSRRDSFITHRAFCDALAEEAARLSAASSCCIMNPPPASFSMLSNYNPPLLPGTSLWEPNPPHPPPPLLSAAAAPPFLPRANEERRAELSATALLQKAAQMGVVSIGRSPSLLAPFDMLPPPPATAGDVTRDFLGVGIQTLCHSGWI